MAANKVIKLDGPKHVFFKMGEAMDHYQSIKKNESSWLQVKSHSSSAQLHMDFVKGDEKKRRRRRRKKTFRDEDEDSLLEEEKDSPLQINDKKTHRSLLLHHHSQDFNSRNESDLEEEDESGFKKATKANVLGLRQRKRSCALCEYEFPPESLVEAQLRSSIFALRRIFNDLQKNNGGDASAVSFDPLNNNDSSSSRWLLNQHHQGLDDETAVEDRTGVGKYKYSRMYDLVKVCRFCNQFFPFEQFQKGAKKGNSFQNNKNNSNNQEVEMDDEDGDDDAELQLPAHLRVFDAGNGVVQLKTVVNPDQPVKVEEHPVLPTKTDDNCSVISSNTLKEEANRMVHFLPVPPMKRKVCPRPRPISSHRKTKHKTNEEIAKEIKQLDGLCRLLEKKLKGKKVKNMERKMNEYMGILCVMDEKPWVPSGAESRPATAVKKKKPKKKLLKKGGCIDDGSSPNNNGGGEAMAIAKVKKAIKAIWLSKQIQGKGIAPSMLRSLETSMQKQLKHEIRRLGVQDKLVSEKEQQMRNLYTPKKQ